MLNKIVKPLQPRDTLLLLLKILTCFGGLFLMFAILSPIASLQMKSAVESASPKTNVHGKVVFEDTGKPVRQTVVTFLNLSGRGSGESSVLTDYDGNFVMENVMSGKYFPMIISPGILTPFSYIVIDENLNRTNEAEIPKMIEKNVQPIKVGSEKNLDVTIVAHRGGSISGQVVYGDGTPAYGVAIEALRKVDDKYAPVFDFQNLERLGNPVIITDEKGNYQASALPPGEYEIRALEAVNHGGKPEILPMMGPFVGYYSSLFSTFYPSAMTPGDAQKIEVKANQETPAVNIKIMQRSSHTIRGKLIDRATKEPLANKTIYLRKVGNPASFLDFAYMRDSRGRVEAHK